MPCRRSPGGEHGNGSGRKRRAEYPVSSMAGIYFPATTQTNTRAERRREVTGKYKDACVVQQPSRLRRGIVKPEH